MLSHGKMNTGVVVPLPQPLLLRALLLEVLRQQHQLEVIALQRLPQALTLDPELGDGKPTTTLSKAWQMASSSSTTWEARDLVFLTSKLCLLVSILLSTNCPSSTWGNSLSYASSDANSGSASPVTLADTLIDDNKEIIIFTDKPCNGGCGTVRDGTVAYRK